MHHRTRATLPIVLASALLAPAAPTAHAADGVVEGTVTYTGPAPKGVFVPDANAERPPVEVHPRTRGLKDAAVWLEGVPAPKARAERKAAKMDQVNYFFTPHVLAV